MTKIEWVARPGTIPESWNPVTGCTKISEGCRNCYAERMARRLAGRCGYPEAPHYFDVMLHPDKLEQPLRWKKPRTVFVCSMSDLFHKDVPFAFIGKVFATIIAADWHTFQILTKRSNRMQEFVAWFQTKTALHLNSFRHIWLGVTAENQKTADGRIPRLLQTPAAVRFLSCEPLLGPIDLKHWLGWWNSEEKPKTEGQHGYPGDINWVIVGGESGPNARPMHPDWARSIHNQCQAARVAYFHKQNGEYILAHENPGAKDGADWIAHQGSWFRKVGKKQAGHLLDSRQWHQWPNVGEQ